MDKIQVSKKIKELINYNNRLIVSFLSTYEVIFCVSTILGAFYKKYFKNTKNAKGYFTDKKILCYRSILQIYLFSFELIVQTNKLALHSVSIFCKKKTSKIIINNYLF